VAAYSCRLPMFLAHSRQSMHDVVVQTAKVRDCSGVAWSRAAAKTFSDSVSG